MGLLSLALHVWANNSFYLIQLTFQWMNYIVLIQRQILWFDILVFISIIWELLMLIATCYDSF